MTTTNVDIAEVAGELVEQSRKLTNIMSSLQSTLSRMEGAKQDLDFDEQFKALLGNPGDPGCEDKVKAMIENGWDIHNVVFDHGATTALHWASASGNLSLVKALLPRSIRDILKKDGLGNTALHAAVMSNVAGVLAVLLEQIKKKKLKAVGLCNNKGKTLLHIAVTFVDRINVIRLLTLLPTSIDDIVRPDNDGNTPLHVAAFCGYHGTFNYMIERLGANFDADQYVNNDGNTPLHVAMTKGRDNMCILLIKLGASLYKLNKAGLSPLMLLGKVHQPLQVRIMRKVLKRILSTDLAGISEELMRLLTVPEVGHLLVLHNCLCIGKLDLVKPLFRHFDVEHNRLAQLLVEKDSRFTGETSLHVAAYGQDVAVLNMVVEKLQEGGDPWDVDCTNNMGQTPLHIAFAGGNTKMVERLLELKADINKTDNMGTGMLHFACRGKGRKVEVLELLEEKLGEKLEISKATKTGLTPLHYAAWNDKEEAGKWLIDRNADLTAEDSVEGLMPWHWAVIRGSGRYTWLVNSHLERSVRLFNGNVDFERWQQVFHSIEAHRSNEPDLVCRKVLNHIQAQHRKLEPGLLACIAALGDEQAKDYILKIVKESRILEWAAFYAKNTTRGRTRASDVEPMFRALEILSQLDRRGKEQLNRYASSSQFLVDAFKIGFLSADVWKSGFATRLATASSRWGLGDLIKSVLPRWSDQESKENLNRVHRSSHLVHMSISNLVEDIPLAYWFTRLKEKSTAESTDSGRSNQEENKSKALVKKVEDLLESRKIGGMLEYPNDKGVHTGRTALHWSTIFEETSTTLSILHTRNCRVDIFDNFGKAPYWYAPKSWKNSFLLNSMKWEQYLDNLHRDREVFVDALNAILVGAALIASVTYSGSLSPPLQYSLKFMNHGQQEDDLKYVAINNPGVKAFWIFNSLSFFFAMASALAGVAGILPLPQVFDLGVIDRLRWTLLLAASLLVGSICFVLVAFACAGFAVLPPLFRYNVVMIVTSVPGGLLCMLMTLLFIKALSPLLSWAYTWYTDAPGLEAPKQEGRVEETAVDVVDTEDQNAGKILRWVLDPSKQPVYSGVIYRRLRGYPWMDGLERLGQSS
ncbi:uncharacterized protein LOC112349923 isoform X2 [Selaginella moellendorffii]|uniref:uncharacterized protein LOC112349923 isoform X2 n=1 Tax=Selaginella moellendorffii TaxID=88036 RepID=UPI000D1C681A|nr:uncharacterized protein LOC112349923 isoform X2 [Selaginella moellendorffii]|eukprot:XP_024540979.1 uncharacterized protein LOC112349923 isoform X2 [Selaginella moellendorffii]